MRAVLEFLFLGDWKNRVVALAFAGLTWWVISDLTDGVSDPIAVPVRVELPDPYVLVSPVNPGVELVVSGPKGLVNEVVYNREKMVGRHRIELTQQQMDLLDLDDLEIREPIRPADFPLPPGVEVRVQPERLWLKLARKVSGSLVVDPRFTGQPAAGHRIARVAVAPSEIQVRVPAKVFQSHSTVATEPIDLSGREGPFSVDRRLVPVLDDIPIPYTGTVRVQVDIEPEPGERQLDRVPIKIMYGPDWPYKVTLGVREVGLTLRGPRDVLDGLRPEDLRVWIDVSEDEPQPVPYKKRPEVQLPPGVEAVDLPEVIFDVEER